MMSSNNKNGEPSTKVKFTDDRKCIKCMKFIRKTCRKETTIRNEREVRIVKEN